MPQFCGTPENSGTIRTHPADFFVDEVLGFEPDGAGEHLFVQIEKTGANTPWVASRLADMAGVSPRDVSYAGRKDRHAVARQWFSIWLPGRCDPVWDNADIEGVQILKSMRHGRKLRRGALAGNCFVIVVRQLEGPQSELEKRLLHIRDSGVPNFFGPQRFGRVARIWKRHAGGFAASCGRKRTSDRWPCRLRDQNCLTPYWPGDCATVTGYAVCVVRRSTPRGVAVFLSARLPTT